MSISAPDAANRNLLHGRPSPAEAGMSGTGLGGARFGAVDAARGIVVLLMIFSACIAAMPEGYAGQAFLARVAMIATPVLEPALFVIAGLYMHRSIRTALPHFLSRKVTPLVWRYILWAVAGTFVAALLKSALTTGLLLRSLGRALLDPPPMLVIVMALAVCLALLRLLRGLPVIVMLPLAAALEIAHVRYGGPIPWAVCRLFVYLYVGHAFAPELRQLMRQAGAHRALAAVGVSIWGLVNLTAVLIPVTAAGGAHVAALPFASLALGLGGAVAVLVLAALLESEGDSEFLEQAGRKGLEIFLMAFILIEPWRTLAPTLPYISVLGLALCGAAAIVFAIAVSALDWRAAAR